MYRGESVMSIPLRCPNCDSAFSVADESAGNRVNCPACNASLAVPAASADEEPESTTPIATRGPWIVAGVAGILAAAALLFAILSYSRARSLADSLAMAERRADTAVASSEEMKVRLADVERRAQEADVGREDVQARLAAAERKADAAVAAHHENGKNTEAGPAPIARPNDKPARKVGTVTLANGTKRAFTTLSGGRYTSGFAAGGARTETIQRAPGELVFYPAGERLKELLIAVESIQSLAIGPRLEKDPDADDAERLFSVQLTGTDGKQQSWKLEAPLTIYVHWADGAVVEQFLNRDLLGMTFVVETETAKGK